MKTIFTTLIIAFGLLTITQKVEAQASIPMEMTEAMYNNSSIVTKKEGKISWDSGIKLGNSTGGGFNWDDKYVIIAINCTPGNISFNTSGGSSGIYWYIKESPDNSSWSGETWNSNAKENNVNFTLLPSTRYIQICYSGNFAGTAKNIKISEPEHITVTPNPINCGELEVGQSSTDAQLSINWSDVIPLSLTIDNATDFALTSTTIASSLCNFGTGSVNIDFHPQTKGDKTCNIEIRDANNKLWQTVTVTGHAKGHEQNIVWWDEDVTMLSRGDTIYAPFVAATSGLALTELFSSDESVLKIENGNLIPVAAGNAYIVAYQAGDAVTEAVRDTLFLEVTNLLTQRISWEQALNFKWGDEPTQLTATSSVGLPITYEIVENPDNVISLSGDVVTISTTNAGKAIIKATQAGNAEYAAVSMQRVLRVRDPNASCLEEPLCLADYGPYELNTIASKEFNIPASGGKPDKLSLEVSGESLLFFYGGDMYVSEYYDGSYHEIKTISEPKKDTWTKVNNIQLNRATTKIKIETKTGATGIHHLRDIQITRAHYIESAPTSLHIDGQYEATTIETIKVDYSNIQDVVNVTLEDSDNTAFSITPTTFAGNECGEFGSIDLELTYTPTTIGNNENKIIIGNDKDGKIEIPITTTVAKRDQYIPWTLRDSVATTQTLTLEKTIAVSGLPITYTISDESILKLDENNKLVFLQADTEVTITATCAGNEMYNDATPIVRTLHIFKGLPFIERPKAGNEITYEQQLFEIELVDGSAKTESGDPIEGDFIWTNRNIVPNAGENVYYEITFVPYNQSLYSNAKDSVAIIVHKKAQNIIWSMPDSIGVMDSITLDAVATSKLPVSYKLEGSGAAYATIESDNDLNITATAEALDKELIINAWQVGNENYLPSDTVTFTVILRKTRAEFFAATEPIEIEAGTTITIGEVNVYVETSVDGTWDFDDDKSTQLNACVWSLKATFTPANPELCDVISVEIPVNITEK